MVSDLPPDVVIAAVASVDAHVVGRSRAHATAVYTDLQRFLADAPFDAAMVVSPLPYRARHALACLRAGRPTLCLAPMARDLAEHDALAAAAREAGVALMPALARRFRNELRHAAGVAAAGELGRLLLARCDWTLRSGRTPAADWADTLAGCAAQTVDLCRWWLGDVETVSADVAGSCDGAHCVGNLILNHRDGAVSVHHVSRTPRNRIVEHYRIEGTENSLEMVAEAASPEVGEGAGWRDLLADFAASVRRGRAGAVTTEDGRAALEVLDAARVSSAERVKVSLPLVSSAASSIARRRAR